MPSSRSSPGPLGLTTDLLAPESAAVATNIAEQAPIRVVIAISAELERVAWGMVIGSQSDMQLIGKAATCKEALALLRASGVDVTLIDEAILNSDEYERLLRYAKQHSASRFLLVAAHELDYTMRQSRYAFAHSFLLKGVSKDDLLGAVRSCAHSQHHGPG